MSRNWARLPERGSPLALWLIRAIALHVGRPVGRALLYPITLYFLMTAAAARRGSQRFLRRALGREPSWREVFRHIHCFAATILDRVYFLTGRLDGFQIEIHGGQAILDQVASGRGCILLGSHLGSFEALRGIGSTVRHLPIKILMNVEHNQDVYKRQGILLIALVRAKYKACRHIPTFYVFGVTLRQNRADREAYCTSIVQRGCRSSGIQPIDDGLSCKK